MTEASSLQHRVILLTTARSYRNAAFLNAAARLKIAVVQAVDMQHELADYWNHALGVPFDDPASAVQTVVDFAAGQPVDAILAVDDSGALIAAQASDRLGLPHNDPAAAMAARDKYLMRQRMSSASVPCPRFRRCTTADDLTRIAHEVDYPCVVKPLDLNGSRGVIRADDPAQFVAAASRLARLLSSENPTETAHPFLVEEYVSGVEVALEGILDQGALTVLALFDKPDPLEGPFFEETIYVTPSRLPGSVQAAIADCAARAALALGLSTGPIHAELRVNERGPWMLEVAGRSIGGLCSRTLRFDTDQSLEELILRQACGLGIPVTTRDRQASGVMMIPIPEAGILKGVEGVEAALQTPGVEEVEITAKHNYPLVPLPEGESYLGFIFARAESPEEVETALRAAHDKLHFRIVPEFQLGGFSHPIQGVASTSSIVPLSEI